MIVDGGDDDSGWLDWVEHRAQSGQRTVGMLWANDWALAVFGCIYLRQTVPPPSPRDPFLCYLNWQVVSCRMQP